MTTQTRRIEAICKKHQTPLPAAALRFLLANPIVSAIIPGALAPEHVQSNVKLLQQPIPAALWAELKSTGLIEAAAPTP